MPTGTKTFVFVSRFPGSRNTSTTRICALGTTLPTEPLWVSHSVPVMIVIPNNSVPP